MSLIYTEQDYFGVIDDNYLNYESGRRSLRGTIFNSSINSLKNAKILIAGCGFGGLVEELMSNRQFNDVWGFDASTYAVGRNTYPSRSSRILQGDVLSSQSMSSVARDAGLRGNQRFSLAITEDLLPCMASLAEVQTALINLRAISQTVAHVISCWNVNDWGIGNTYRHADGSIRHINGDTIISMPGFLWWTPQEWIAAINNNSEWIFQPDMIRIQ